jgi:hypothetical protein
MQSRTKKTLRRHLPFAFCLLPFVFCLEAAPAPTFAILADQPGAWPQILSCVGFRPAAAAQAGIFVVRANAPAIADWPARVEKGAVLILEGESSIAESFGFRAGEKKVRVGSITDVHRPKLPIIWQQAQELPVYGVPREARVFARERWTGAPVLAGYRKGAGAVLWVEVSPGANGYERFPYILHALSDLGLDPPLHSARLWAFFDYAYRSRVDVDYFGPGARQVHAGSDRRLPPQRHPGLRLARVAAC